MTNGPVSADPGAAPGASTRTPLIRHPWRVVAVVAILLVVGNLAIVLFDSSDTSRSGRTFPNAVETVVPLPGELLRPQDGIVGDLRDDLAGVLEIDGVEVPEDQLEPIINSRIAFRPGTDKDIEEFAPGQHTATVRYWDATKERPANPPGYSWTFRAGA